jgi:hypothetical protein
MKYKSIFKILLVFCLIFTFIPSLVQAQATYRTTDDNANNAGTYGVPDGDMDDIMWNDNATNPIEFYIDTPGGSWINATLTIRAYDVDYGDGERDQVYINGYVLGNLTGSGGTWSETLFPVDPSFLDSSGQQLIQIDVDITSGIPYWYVIVDWGELALIPRPGPVGGEILSINKLQLILPYLLVTTIAITTASILHRKRFL